MRIISITIIKCITFLGLVLISSDLLGQTNSQGPAAIMAEVISRAKQSSLYTKSVDWHELEGSLLPAAQSAKTTKDLKPQFESLINSLRDHHGTVINLEDYSRIANFTDYENTRKTDQRERDPEIWKVVNDVDSRFEYALLDNNIGYLKIVGVGPNLDGQAEAIRIRNAVLELHQKGVTQWIIDLRYNGGGNVNVMLSGIAPLLDTNEVASVIDKDGLVQARAIIENGNFTYHGAQAFQMENTESFNNPRITILMSRWTVSSGEMVAIAFKGQQYTRFFGEATGGYTTNNGWDIINDEIALVISTGIFTDRNGTVYTENVKPDQEVEFQVTKNQKEDTGILEAIEWLRQKE